MASNVLTASSLQHNEHPLSISNRVMKLVNRKIIQTSVFAFASILVLLPVRFFFVKYWILLNPSSIVYIHSLLFCFFTFHLPTFLQSLSNEMLSFPDIIILQIVNSEEEKIDHIYIHSQSNLGLPIPPDTRTLRSAGCFYSDYLTFFS